MTLTLDVLPGRFAVCRLPPDAPLPQFPPHTSIHAITCTADELSIVCAEDDAPDGARVEKGWACLKIQGPIDFSLTGVLASVLAPLAESRHSIFALSTFDTDYVLVRAAHLDAVCHVLRQAGHEIVNTM